MTSVWALAALSLGLALIATCSPFGFEIRHPFGNRRWNDCISSVRQLAPRFWNGRFAGHESEAFDVQEDPACE